MEHIVNKEDSKEKGVFSTSKSNAVSKKKCASREEAKDEGLQQRPSTESEYSVHFKHETMKEYKMIEGEETLVKREEYEFSKSMKTPSARSLKVTKFKQSEIQKLPRPIKHKLNANASGSGTFGEKGKKEWAIPGPSKLLTDSFGSGQLPKVAKQFALSAPSMKMGNSLGKKEAFENTDPKFGLEKLQWPEIDGFDKKKKKKKKDDECIIL